MIKKFLMSGEPTELIQQYWRRTNMKHSLKRVFIIHGYKSYPKDCWFPWLKKELIKRGFKVNVPRLPNSDRPTRLGWVSSIKRFVGKSDVNTYFIGHSLGVPAILRYIEELPDQAKIGGVISLAGRIIDKPIKRRQTHPFYQDGFKWSKIKKIVRKFVGIYSLDDPVVPLSNGKLFKNKLGAKLILEKNKGHFSREDKVFKLPIVLKAILELSK